MERTREGRTVTGCREALAISEGMNERLALTGLIEGVPGKFRFYGEELKREDERQSKEFGLNERSLGVLYG